MAAPKSARRSRKRRSSSKTPRAVRSARRERAAVRATATPAPRRSSVASTYGERPPGPFGGLPVSEVAIFAGMVGVVVGWLRTAPVALITGVAVCCLGVLEVTAREHFSGYRSHSVLLAAMVAVAVETALALLVAPHARALLLIVVIPVFAATFTALRRRFTAARQARVRALPPA